MVSAVFHAPLDTAPAATQDAINNIATSALPTGATTQKHSKNTPTKAPADRDWAASFRSFWLAVLPPLCGLGLLLGVWALVSAGTGSGPLEPGPGSYTRHAGSCQLRHSASTRSPAVTSTQASSGAQSGACTWRSATSTQPPAKAHRA